MKYIMFEDFAGKPLPIIFPERIEFDEFREQIPYSAVRSAGFVVQDPQGLRCYGKAKNLGPEEIVAHPDDAAIIAESFVEKE